jgi:hypothetical protein
MQTNEQHASRRKSAAAAAAAADMRPINANQTPRRPIRMPGAAPKAPKAPTPRAPPAASASASASARAAPDAGPWPAPSADLPDFSGAVEGMQNAAGKASKPPDAPPGPLPRDANGERSLLQSRAGIDADESCGAQEYALSSYLKLHPVLSLESTSYETLQLVSNLVEGTSIPTKELEIVPKPYDDGYLRPPNAEIGERPCNFGNRCICVWMARWRYGDDTDMAFIGTEFLLPSQSAEFKKSGKLPHTNGKCLVCSRYVTTYIYRCARADPTFKPSASIPLQAYGNSLGVEAGENVPTHSSVAIDSDGYRQEALLFVDEQWADTAAARGGMASLLWRPCVKFDTSHYTYVRDPNGLPRLLQRNVGAEDESSASHFCQPAGTAQRPPLPASTPTPPPNPPSST